MLVPSPTLSPSHTIGRLNSVQVSPKKHTHFEELHSPMG